MKNKTNQNKISQSNPQNELNKPNVEMDANSVSNYDLDINDGLEEYDANSMYDEHIAIF